MSDNVGSLSVRPSVCFKIPLLLTTVSVILFGHFYFPDERKAFVSRQGNLRESAPWWDGGHCPCRDTHCMQRHSLPLTMEGVGGTCGRRAWASGERQRVITYSLFGNGTEYSEGLDDILRTAKHLYPGWKVWIYTKPRGREDLLCPLLHAHPHLFICDVTNLPPPLGDVTSVNPRMWRFLAMSDGHLSSMVVRDSDSQITEREAAAVRDWLSCNRSFHLMRDHPSHVKPVLAGLWGARWDLQGRGSALAPEDLKALRDALAIHGRGTLARDQDQQVLANVLWPVMKNHVIAHNSFSCKLHPEGTRPFPTRRLGGEYVGNKIYTKNNDRLLVKRKCPVECRPLQHQDWLYC